MFGLSLLQVWPILQRQIFSQHFLMKRLFLEVFLFPKPSHRKVLRGNASDRKRGKDHWPKHGVCFQAVSGIQDFLVYCSTCFHPYDLDENLLDMGQ